MSITRCEFCELALKSDLDVSKHLVSQTHRDNVAKAISLYPCKETARDTPKNIAKVFESLKLRTVKDVKNLADKGYFRIPQDSPNIVKVADQLVKVFLKCIAEHKLKDCSPRTRKIVMDSFEVVKVEVESNKQQQPARQQVMAEQNVVVAPVPQAVRSQAPRPIATPPQGPRPQPPVPQAVRSQAPRLNTMPPQGPRPQAPTPQAVRSQAPRPNTMPPQGPRPQAPTPQAVRSQGSRPNAMPPQGPRPQAPTPQAVRSQAPRLNAMPPQGSRPQAPRSRESVPQHTTSRVPGPQTGPRPAGNRPNVVNHAQRLPTPNQQRAVRPTRQPTNLVPPPSQMPMAGASFMPRQPCNDDAPPQPRLDSTYRPQLARIKVEPRDD